MFDVDENLPLLSCWCIVEPQGVPAWFDHERRKFVGSGFDDQNDWEVPLNPQPTAWTLYLKMPSLDRPKP